MVTVMILDNKVFIVHTGFTNPVAISITIVVPALHVALPELQNSVSCNVKELLVLAT